MIKRVFGVLLLLLVAISFVSAAENITSDDLTTTETNSGSDDAIDKAYQCLEDQIENKTLSLQEAVFSTLALGSDNDLKEKIEDEKKSNEACWPANGCKLKDTAQVMLAYDRIGKNTKDIEKWILSKNATTTDLSWYLEIDITNRVVSDCTIRYDGSDKKIKIGEDMKLSGSTGSCLSISPSGYWLKMKDSCLGKEFEISCNQDFITTLLYEKTAGGTIYVSSETHSASSLGTTTEKVNAKCFKSGTTCDYEGSLWAAVALNRRGIDVSEFVPYLLALADDNKKFFPSSFLYILTAGEDQYSQITSLQKQSKYWEMSGTPYNRFYDTSLGMLSLSSTGAAELENAKQYLLSIQTKEGCWNNNNIRDTAFILYSGWSKGVTKDTGSGSGGSTILCASKGYSCEIVTECYSAGGNVLNDYDCSNFGESCCSVAVQEQSCSQKDGIVCSIDQECQGQSVPSSSGSCCLGSCVVAERENSCESLGRGTCRDSCFDDESVTSDICSDAGQICCSTEDTSSGSGWIWFWIILLLILIIIAAFAIKYKDKIRVWWYKWRGNAKSGPVNKPKPGAPGMPMQQPRPMFKPFAPTPQSRPIPRKVSPAESEMEDTLKKLRDMSK